MTKPVGFSEDGARRVIAATKAYEGGNRNMPPIAFRQPSGDDGLVIRIGQFTGAWSNEPPYNMKIVQLYTKHPTSSSPNAWVPDTGNFASAMNLFSYIPTPRGGPNQLWCSLIPIAEGDFEFIVPETGDTATASTVWLLLAAEC